MSEKVVRFNFCPAGDVMHVLSSVAYEQSPAELTACHTTKTFFSLCEELSECYIVTSELPCDDVTSLTWQRYEFQCRTGGPYEGSHQISNISL